MTGHLAPPAPDRAAVERATGELFGQLFAGYDDPGFRATVELFERRFRANGFDTGWFQGKTCLDAGCGGGRYSIALSLLGAERVEGVDVADAAIADARRRADQLGRSNVCFQVASLLEIPFPDRSFDFVCCSGVLMITRDPEQAAAELSRVLKPGGILYLLVYATEGMRWPLIQLLRPIAAGIGFEAMDRALSLAGLPFAKKRTYMDDLFCPILDFYSWDRLRALLERHGFDRTQRWEQGRLDHEESLSAYAEDLEALAALWRAGADAGAPELRRLQPSFEIGARLTSAAAEAVRLAEQEVQRGEVSENEAMRRVIGQGHHRLLAWKRDR